MQPTHSSPPPAQGSSSHPGPPTVGNTSGVGGGGERPFPPNSGLTFSTWVQITRCVPDSSQTVGLLTLSQTFLTHDKQVLTCMSSAYTLVVY